MSLSANFPTTRPSLLLDFVNSGQMDPRITFSRASGATWFNSAGTLIGVDASSSSLTVGTGQQTLTLAATAGVDRGWIVGTSVLLSASTVTNTMTGVVVSYTASTQVLVVNVASVVGSGTYSTWQVSNLMPRFDYNPSTLAAQGLLIEESRTNLLLQSEDFATTWTVSGSTITTNSTSAPSGSVTADSIVEDATTSAHRVAQAVSANSTVIYTATCFIKANGRTWATILLDDNGGNGVRGFFNLSNGTLGTLSINGTATSGSQAITPINNGWYRCTVSCIPSSVNSTNVRLLVAGTTGDTVSSYAGSAGLTSVFVWGAQLEAGAFPTSYIPTTTTALTRSADVASVNTLSPWFNASAGTLYGEITDAAIAVGGVSRRIANINDGTESDRITITYAGGAGIATAFVTDNTVQQAGFFSPSGAYPFPTKVALAYAVNDFQASVNGSAFAAVTSGTLPTVNRMTLGDIVTGGMQQNLNGHLRRVTYYPRRLSQAELIAITA
jgi:hypothetical protein